jgi:hypothetical protein
VLRPFLGTLGKNRGGLNSVMTVGKTSTRIVVAKEPIVRGALEASGPEESPVPSFARKWRTRRDETSNTYVIEIAI